MVVPIPIANGGDNMIAYSIGGVITVLIILLSMESMIKKDGIEEVQKYYGGSIKPYIILAFLCGIIWPLTAIYIIYLIIRGNPDK